MVKTFFIKESIPIPHKCQTSTWASISGASRHFFDSLSEPERLMQGLAELLTETILEVELENRRTGETILKVELEHEAPWEYYFERERKLVCGHMSELDVVIWK